MPKPMRQFASGLRSRFSRTESTSSATMARACAGYWSQGNTMDPVDWVTGRVESGPCGCGGVET